MVVLSCSLTNFYMISVSWIFRLANEFERSQNEMNKKNMILNFKSDSFRIFQNLAPVEFCTIGICIMQELTNIQMRWLTREIQLTFPMYELVREQLRTAIMLLPSPAPTLFVKAPSMLLNGRPFFMTWNTLNCW